MLVLIGLYFYLFQFASCSILTAPPLSALIIAFEDVYDLSLLANTLSDQGIDTTLIIPNYSSDELYNNLIDVEVLQLDVDTDKLAHAERAVEACDTFLRDQEILKRIQEFQPTFTIFPALRHDGCLLPWVRHIESIPVIWAANPEGEFYVFQETGVALPVHNNGILTSLSRTISFFFSTHKTDYLPRASRLISKYLPHVNIDLKYLYSDVRLVLWGADIVLRSDFASLTQLLVEVGCHHCRGPHPLPGDLQKLLVEHKLGTIIALLDQNYESLLYELADKLPQGREGQAIVWKINKSNTNAGVKNLFIRGDIDRQDLIGYSRTRVVLSHCTDTEFLEAAFHGTPVICLPRNTHETRNTNRAVELGFARTTSIEGISADKIATVVHEIHEMGVYRENARVVSLAIRDRLNPPSDRLIYWLRYVARTKDGSETFHRVKGPVRTLTEDFLICVCVGILIGAVLFDIAKAYIREWFGARRVRRYAR